MSLLVALFAETKYGTESHLFLKTTLKYLKRIIGKAFYALPAFFLFFFFIKDKSCSGLSAYLFYVYGMSAAG